MKRISTAALLLVLIIGRMQALDTGSYQFIDHLLNLSGPGAPEIFEDGVIFTASAVSRKVGIAFAHEDFAKVHWFQRLLIPEDQGPPVDPKKERPVVYRETGILFFAYSPPENLRELAYRMIIDGLWTVDPLNPRQRSVSPGQSQSTIALPPPPPKPAARDSPPGTLSFLYQAPPGERITVAGSFNGWDPFMYELRETGSGVYALTLSLPPGTYQYAFFHRGERIPDPVNPQRVYTREGRQASEAVVR
jgi:hypothetical protein